MCISSEQILIRREQQMQTYPPLANTQTCKYNTNTTQHVSHKDLQFPFEPTMNTDPTGISASRDVRVTGVNTVFICLQQIKTD